MSCLFCPPSFAFWINSLCALYNNNYFEFLFFLSINKLFIHITIDRSQDDHMILLNCSLFPFIFFPLRKQLDITFSTLQFFAFLLRWKITTRREAWKGMLFIYLFIYYFGGKFKTLFIHFIWCWPQKIFIFSPAIDWGSLAIDFDPNFDYFSFL